MEEEAAGAERNHGEQPLEEPVSYTHLTLPTKLEV